MAFNVHATIENRLATPLVPVVTQTGILHGSLAQPLTRIPPGAEGIFDITGSLGK